jgi:hypothetical protein
LYTARNLWVDVRFGQHNSGFVGEKRNAYGFLMGNLQERDRFEDPELDGRVLLKWIYKEM